MAPHTTPDSTADALARLTKRILIPTTPDSPPGLVQANTVDPWSQSGKYGLGWTYFAVALTGIVIVVRLWHFWQDKIRQAIYKQQVEEYYRSLWAGDISSQKLEVGGEGASYAESVPHGGEAFSPQGQGLGNNEFRPQAHFSSVGFINDTLALFRWVFYRPLPDVVWRQHRFTFSSLAVLACVFAAVAFVSLYCFVLQPLYWESIRFGSPPVAVRSGMMAVALTPWIVATSTKANLLSMATGIGPERLNVLHRWLGYLCLYLSLVHMIPFWVQPVWEDGGMSVFGALFPAGSGIVYGSGVACFVPLAWLCVGSLPAIRRKAYELFVVLHAPIGVVYVGVLFWHTKNLLMSWGYLWASVAVFAVCQVLRLFNLNWARPSSSSSFLVGDEAAITLMSENCIKVTIPTRMRWKPGQYVYLRMPAISVLENHPFTISSLCSEGLPSEYGEQYRDCTLVFRPYGGFTRRVLETAVARGPLHTYRAFLDGPYGGMTRDLAAFDTCILIAGGSGITALVSQLLYLIKRMRDAKAITKKVVVVWALKRLEAMDWFREELRICRESAPPDSVTCKFFVTSAVRNRNRLRDGGGGGGQRSTRALAHAFHDQLDGFVAGMASKRNSALLAAEAQGDPNKERELRAENEDRITALPHQRYILQKHVALRKPEGDDDDDYDLRKDVKNDVKNDPRNEKHDNAQETRDATTPAAPPRAPSDLPVRAPELAHLRTSFNPPPNANRTSNSTTHNTLRAHPAAPAAPAPAPAVSTFGPPAGFDFGFPETPTEFQKSLMRFAFPVPHQMEEGGWTVEYGRPDLGFMLREWATGGVDGRGILGRRTAVFVCGPPAMRVGVANSVARLQAEIWGDDMLEEIYLHTENYAL